MHALVNRYKPVALFLALLIAAGSSWSEASHTTSPFRVRDFGAVGDGVTSDTNAVQKAIDTCADSGGGTVYFAPGTYRCGSLHLRSNITLHLDNGATILASTDDADFDPYEVLGFENDSDEETSYFHFSLLWGEDVENIAIVGQGTIDSNRKGREGPKTIGLKRCKNVTIRDITIQNAGNYGISMLGTDNVKIDGITMRRSYCDGIDPDSCHNVQITNCDIESWDDAIVPKTSFSLGYRRSTEHITVSNCILRTSCNGFKLGTESGGDFKHITVSNCVIMPFSSKVNYREPTLPISGISLISADGANIENILINNITMDKVRCPLFIRLSNRGRDLETPVPGTMNQVIISNITASDALIGAIIIGQPDRPIENLLLDNIKITCQGGGTPDDSQMDISAAMKKYPSASKFRDLPTYGFYLLHVRGIRLDNIDLRLEKKDTRHALIAEEVADLSMDSFRAPTVKNAAAQLSFRQVQGAFIQDSRPSEVLETFLRVSGDRSTGIVLSNNDFTNVSNAVVLDKGVASSAVRNQYN